MVDYSTPRSREVGRRAASIRRAANISGSSIAAKIGNTVPSVCRFEAGVRDALPPERVIQYLTLCGQRADQIDAMVGLLRAPDNGYHVSTFGGDTPGELQTLIQHETVASTIQNYESALVPGLLQSPDYADALFRAGGRLPPGEIEGAVRRRMSRQTILERPAPPRCTFFVGEAALRAVVGDHAIMHDQLMRLFFACAWPNCAVRVVPAGANGRIGTISAFRLMTFQHYAPVATQDLFAAMAFMDRPADIVRFRVALERLAQVALPLRPSRDFIMYLADEHGWLSRTEHAEHDPCDLPEQPDVAPE